MNDRESTCKKIWKRTWFFSVSLLSLAFHGFSIYVAIQGRIDEDKLVEKDPGLNSSTESMKAKIKGLNMFLSIIVFFEASVGLFELCFNFIIELILLYSNRKGDDKKQEAEGYKPMRFNADLVLQTLTLFCTIMTSAGAAYLADEVLVTDDNGKPKYKPETITQLDTSYSSVRKSLILDAIIFVTTILAKHKFFQDRFGPYFKCCCKTVNQVANLAANANEAVEMVNAGKDLANAGAQGTSGATGDNGDTGATKETAQTLATERK